MRVWGKLGNRKKMKRVLAAVLSVLLVESTSGNPVLAVAAGIENAAETAMLRTKSLATPSDSEETTEDSWIATPGNAEQLDEIPLLNEKEISKVIMTPQKQTYTLVEMARNQIKMDLEFEGSGRLEVEIWEKVPGGEFQYINETTLRRTQDELRIIHNESPDAPMPQQEGVYEYYLVAEEGEQKGQIVSNTVKVEVKKTSEEVRVTLEEPLFTGIYNNGQPPMNASNIYYLYTGRDKFKAVYAETNEPYYGDLTGIKIQREAGNEPGEYKILSASCKEVEKLTFDGPYGTFVIHKKPYENTRERDAYSRADGREHTIAISTIWGLYDHYHEIPEKVTVGQLSEEEQKRFEKLPVQEKPGDTISFCLKETDENFEVKIPLQLESKYIEFPPMTLHLKVNFLEYVKTPTKEEIKAFKKAHPFSAKSDVYEERPSLSAERAGKLSAASRENALNALNFYRFVAGIPCDVEYDEQLEYYAQAGTTLLTGVGEMTHYPDKPSGVSQEFYEDGYKGTSSSNLGKGHSNIVDALNRGWMNDGDANNIAGAGHRAWCLNVPMGKTGFGHSGAYTAMWAFDESSEESANPAYVMWPAQTMPVEYFYGPWSVFLENFDYYKYAEEESVKVTMHSKKKGKTYELTAADKDVYGEYLNVSAGCIIFQPGVGFSSGDEVEVSISGLKNIYGEDENISYTVHFFSMGGSSSGGSGGGGSTGGGGGGGSSTGGGAGGPGGSGKAVPRVSQNELPAYVVKGTWSQTAEGVWSFTDRNGLRYVNCWAAVYNPFANTEAGFQAFDWFRFDENGVMVTGWYTDLTDGNIYYLNPQSDGTRGRMMTGWTVIDGKEYYFNPNSDGTRGRMFRNQATKDGHFLGTDGVKTY